MAVYRSKHANRKPSIAMGFTQLAFIVFVVMGIALAFVPNI